MKMVLNVFILGAVRLELELSCVEPGTDRGTNFGVQAKDQSLAHDLNMVASAWASSGIFEGCTIVFRSSDPYVTDSERQILLSEIKSALEKASDELTD
jgi:hypothetical protein